MGNDVTFVFKSPLGMQKCGIRCTRTLQTGNVALVQPFGCTGALIHCHNNNWSQV